VLRPVVRQIDKILALDSRDDAHALEILVVAFGKLPSVDFDIPELSHIRFGDVGIFKKRAKMIAVEVIEGFAAGQARGTRRRWRPHQVIRGDTSTPPRDPHGADGAGWCLAIAARAPPSRRRHFSQLIPAGCCLVIGTTSVKFQIFQYVENSIDIPTHVARRCS
jgi:hypothetical protein